MARGWKYETGTETVHLTLRRSPGPYTGRWLSIVRLADTGAMLYIPPRYRHDGATLAPDFAVTRAATVLHDAVYQLAELIVADVIGWSVRQVLRWGDEVFLERMLKDVRRPAHRRGWRYLGAMCVQLWDTAVAYTYYGAVRLAGYRYHMLARRIFGPAELRTKRRTALPPNP